LFTGDNYCLEGETMSPFGCERATGLPSRDLFYKDTEGVEVREARQKRDLNKSREAKSEPESGF